MMGSMMGSGCPGCCAGSSAAGWDAEVACAPHVVSKKLSTASKASRPVCVTHTSS